MENKKTLVIGASEKSERYSNQAVNMLQEYKHPVVAYGRRKGIINDTEIITDFPKNKDFHTVTLYVSAKNQEEYYQAIIDLKPERVIFNPGTENKDFQELLVQNGIGFEEACTLVLLRTGQF